MYGLNFSNIIFRFPRYFEVENSPVPLILVVHFWHYISLIIYMFLGVSLRVCLPANFENGIAFDL